MGKGYIIAHKGAGLYDVRLTYAYRSRITERLALYTVQIAALDIKIAAETDVNKKALLKLQRASVQKLYDYYSTKMPADPAVEAWCADLTEDLAYGTVVGTIEIPGEQVTVLVRPAYDGRSIYSSARDGMLMPAIAGSAHQVLFNWMLLPGWQRHKPIYRTGTISAIDYEANTCTVCLEPAYSSQQNLPAIDGLTVADCGATALAGASDFCTRYPTHPFCTNSEEGSEINLDTGQLAQLQTVNSSVNLNYGRQGDPSGYRTGDSWDVMAPGGSGDCEDFALTKMQQLVDTYGWSPANLKLVTGYTSTGVYHAMLGVRTSNYGLMILDVNNDPVVSSTKLPYRIDKIAMTATSWKNYSRQLTAVPIEYMDCNAWAFAAGDNVVVQFIDQKWTTPKVVGFAEEPKPCSVYIWRHGVVGLYFSGAWRYGSHDDSWTQFSYTPASGGFGDSGYYYYPVGAVSFDDSGNQWIFGGLRASWYDPPFAKKCLRFNTVSEAYVSRADHPDPGRAQNQNAWYLQGSSYLLGGLRVYVVYETSELIPPPIISEISAKDENQSFNDSLNSWTSKQSMPHANHSAIDFAISGIGYIGGGNNYDNTTYDNLHSFDPAANSWTSKTDLPRGLVFSQGATISGKGYALMGYATEQYPGDTPASYRSESLWLTKWLTEYDPIANAWSNKSQGPYTKNFMGAVGANAEVWSQSEIDGGGVLQKYNPADETWSSFPGGPDWDHSRLSR